MVEDTFEERSILREGLVSGVIGATSVALWFLILDVFAGRPFATPVMLGTSLTTVFGDGPPPLWWSALIGYTIFHYAAFIGIGIVFSWIVNRAEKEPSVLIGLLGLFVSFEVGFYGWTALLAQSQYFGRLAWYQVLAANLIASVAMGVYLWVRHPSLHGRLSHVLAGDE
jgi:hypothetical protein